MNVYKQLSILLVSIIIVLLVTDREKPVPEEIPEVMIPALTHAPTLNTSGDAEKQSFGPSVNVFSKTPMVIGSYNEDGTPNVMTASWFGVANSKPVKVGVSIRPETHSYHNIMRTKAFTVNVPDVSQAPFVLFVGKHSGKDMNKFEVTGFTPVRGEFVDAPYVHEFPAVLECRVTEFHDLGSHRHFIGEVIDTKVSKRFLNNKGKIDAKLFSPLFVGLGGYAGMGEVFDVKKAAKAYEKNIPLKKEVKKQE